MSQLIQIKKQLTFEEICPSWTRILASYGGWEKTPKSEYFGGTFNSRSLSNTKCCIVGEAHGDNDEYWFRPGRGQRENPCEICTIFSVNFCGTDVYQQIHNEQEFEKAKSEFVAHFNEAHVK